MKCRAMQALHLLALEPVATPSSGQQMPEQPDTGPEQHNQMHH